MGAGQILDAALEVLRAENPEDFDPASLAVELVSLRQQLDWLEAEWTRRVAAFDEADGRHLEGHTSTTAFLKHRCRMAAGRAQRAVTLSHRLRSLPVTDKAFTAGEVSLDQVRLLADLPARLDHDLSEFESTLIEGMADLSVAQTRGLLSYWQTAMDGPASETDTEELWHRRYFFLSQTLNGMVKGDFLLDPEAGEVMMTALAALTPPRRDADDRTPGQRRGRCTH